MPKLFVKINSLRQIEFIDKIYLGLEKAVCNHPQAGREVYFFFWFRRFWENWSFLCLSFIWAFTGTSILFDAIFPVVINVGFIRANRNFSCTFISCLTHIWTYNIYYEEFYYYHYSYSCKENIKSIFFRLSFYEFIYFYIFIYKLCWSVWASKFCMGPYMTPGKVNEKIK